MNTNTNTMTLVDPADLLTDTNIRKDLRLADNDELVESVKARGVVQAITATRAADGLRVIAGHRRTAAAIKAGLDSVPVQIVDEPACEADRILTQYSENEHRRGITDGEKVAAFTQLAALGLSTAQIAKQAQVDKATVSAAATVATAAQQTADALDSLPLLTIEQAAELAHLDDTPTVQANLIKTIEDRASTSGEIDHMIARAISTRDTPQAEQQARDLLESNGVTVVDSPNYYDKVILPSDRITPKVTKAKHAKACPGHVEYIARYNATGSVSTEVRGRTYEVSTAWGCKDWRKHGHQDRYATTSNSGKPEAGSEEAKAERRRVIALNRAGEAAKRVREDWLTTFTLRKKAPAGAPAWIAEAHLNHYAGDNARRSAAATVLDILGQPHDGFGMRGALAAVIAKKPSNQQTHLMACVALWEQEATIDKQVWRHDGNAAYLKQLEAWGYTLSEAEKVTTGDLTEEAAYQALSSE